MRTLVLAGVLTVLCQEGVESLSVEKTVGASSPGFVFTGSATSQLARKRPREGIKRSASLSTSRAIQGTQQGTFVSQIDSGAWARMDPIERYRRNKLGGHATTMISIHFEPPQMDDLAEGFGRAAVWGLFGALVPVWTRDRLLEKEAGVEVDDAAELEDFFEDEGYICPLCKNSNEVECPECGGKGFFVSSTAQPRKCTFCDGLGSLECPECVDYREEEQQVRKNRRSPFRLPPSTEDDFPFFPFKR